MSTVGVSDEMSRDTAEMSHRAAETPGPNAYNVKFPKSGRSVHML